MKINKNKHIPLIYTQILNVQSDLKLFIQKMATNSSEEEEEKDDDSIIFEIGSKTKYKKSDYDIVHQN